VPGLFAVPYDRPEDVVFGSTVSGRYPEIPGIETMIGLLINTLPTRVRLRSGDSFGELVRRVNQEQSRLFPHQYLGLLELQKLTGLKELFDTLVVFENFPVDLEAEKQPSGVRLMDLNVEGTAHYPLIAIVSPGRQLRVSFDYHPNHLQRQCGGAAERSLCAPAYCVCNRSRATRRRN